MGDTAKEKKQDKAQKALIALVADWRKRAKTLRRRKLLAAATTLETQADELEETLEEQPKIGHD